MKEYIKRPIYLKRIEPYIDKNLIKVLTGQRRVGKSYLLLQIMDEIKQKHPDSNIIFINKEDLNFSNINDHKDLVKAVESSIVKNVRNYLMVDEIQDIDEFEKALRHFQSNENVDIYITGSNAGMLSGDLATYLSGRYIEIKVYSLSYSEFLEFNKLKKNKASLLKLMKFGGLPFLKNLSLEEGVIHDYLSNIIATILYKDIVSRYNIRNTYFIDNLIRFLANNTGNIISAKKISDYLKSQRVNTSPQIILNYLAYLENAFLIYKVKREDIKGKRQFEIYEKYFFEDWGIMNSLAGISNFDIGKIIENLIFIHLKIAGYEVTTGQLGDKEVDFIANKDGMKIYLQACYLLNSKQVRSREFGNLAEIKDNYPKYVISLDEYPQQNYLGIQHLHLSDFLMQIVNDEL